MKNIIYPLFFLVALASCEKELDFQYHDVEPQLVIEGTTTDGGTRVSVTYTTPMDMPMNDTRLTDATVTLTDLTDGTSTRLSPDSKGYFTDNTPGVDGHEYRLDVSRDGKRYSAESLMRHKVDILGLEFQWIKMPYDYVAVLQISFTDDGTAGDNYWVRLYRNGEAYKWSLVTDNLADNGIINEVIMTSRKDIEAEDEKDVLLDGDEIRVEVIPVSLEMLDYLQAIQSDSNGPRMFAGDYCLGYYLAAEVSQSTIIFRPDEMTEFK